MVIAAPLLLASVHIQAIKKPASLATTKMRGPRASAKAAQLVHIAQVRLPDPWSVPRATIVSASHQNPHSALLGPLEPLLASWIFMAAVLAWQVTTVPKQDSNSQMASVTLVPTVLVEQVPLLQEMESQVQSALRAATARWGLVAHKIVLLEPIIATLEQDLDMTALLVLLASIAQEQAALRLMEAVQLGTTALLDPRLRTRKLHSQVTTQRQVQLPPLLAQLAPTALSRLRQLAQHALLGSTALI